MIEIPDVERDRLERRILFLRSRAEANLEMEPEDMHSKGCAATLFRDSASLGLLAGRIEMHVRISLEQENCFSIWVWRREQRWWFLRMLSTPKTFLANFRM